MYPMGRIHDRMYLPAYVNKYMEDRNLHDGECCGKPADPRIRTNRRAPPQLKPPPQPPERCTFATNASRIKPEKDGLSSRWISPTDRSAIQRGYRCGQRGLSGRTVRDRQPRPEAVSVQEQRTRQREGGSCSWRARTSELDRPIPPNLR